VNLWRRILIERRAVILPLAVILLGNVAVYTLVVLPLVHSVSSATDASFASTADLARARRDASDAKNARSSASRADEELTRFYQGVLATNFEQARDVADFWLDRTARQSGVIKRGSTYDFELVKNSRLVRVKGKVALEGSYKNIRRFLFATESAKEFIVIESVELAEGGAKGVGTNGDTITVTLSLSTYYVTQGAATQ
jgi:hypothetical protein